MNVSEIISHTRALRKPLRRHTARSLVRSLWKNQHTELAIAYPASVYPIQRIKLRKPHRIPLAGHCLLSGHFVPATTARALSWIIRPRWRRERLVGEKKGTHHRALRQSALLAGNGDHFPAPDPHRVRGGGVTRSPLEATALSHPRPLRRLRTPLAPLPPFRAETASPAPGLQKAEES